MMVSNLLPLVSVAVISIVVFSLNSFVVADPSFGMSMQNAGSMNPNFKPIFGLKHTPIRKPAPMAKQFKIPITQQISGSRKDHRLATSSFEADEPSKGYKLPETLAVGECVRIANGSIAVLADTSRLVGR